MRLKDSSMYLCLSILLCRISLLFFLLALGDTHMVISTSLHNSHPLAELARLPPAAGPGSIAPSGASPLGSSLDLQGSNSGPTGHVEKKRKHHKRVLDNHSGPIIRPNVPDFIDANLAIVSTLDGHLHCINNRDGSIFWTRSPQAAGAVVSTNRFSMRSEAGNELLAHSVGGAPRLEGQPGTGKQSTEDLTFIVEPSETPQLYVYSNISGLQLVGPLAHLVNNSPQIHSDGKRITGGKTTSLLELDINTGNTTSIFNKKDVCAGPDGIEPSKPLTIILGQAEYSLSIVDPTSGVKWEISYSEYFPVKEVPDSQRDVSRKVIGSNQDGVLALVSAGQIKWKNRLLNSPATAVFEVLKSTRRARDEDTFALARQRKRLQPPTAPWAHVGMHSGQLYVLSHENFPFLDDTGTDMIPWHHLAIDGPEDRETEDSQEGPWTTCRPGFPEFPTCIVGNHRIQSRFRPDGPLTVSDGKDSAAEGDRDRPTIDYDHRNLDDFLEGHNVPFRVKGLAKVIGSAAVFGNTSGLPEYSERSTIASVHPDMVHLRGNAILQEKQAEMSEKPDRSTKKAPRTTKTTEQDS
ncbi:bifunctional endoribonuclease/protein kinase ire1, partial [Mortierella alpina]